MLTHSIFHGFTFGRWILSFFLTAFTGNILVVQTLHFIQKVDQPIWFLAFQVLFVGIGLFFLARLDYKGVAANHWDIPGFRYQKPTPCEAVLQFIIPAILVGFLIVGFLVPINNSDSLHTHLPRIYYWLQHGSLENWYTPTGTQITYPINLPIQGLWLFLLGGSERLFFLVPWFSLVVATALVYEIARQLGASKVQALLAALVGLSMPVVLLQSFSYQGDLVIAPLLLASIVFLLYYDKGRQPRYFYLSLITVAIALGTKQTALLFVPVFGLAALWMLLRKRISLRVLLHSLLIFVVSFLLTSSFKFIQNFVTGVSSRGSMFASVSISPEIEGLESATAKAYLVNGLRYFYQGLSVDGLTGRVKLNAIENKAALFSRVTKQLGVDLESPEFTPPGENTYLVLTEIPPLNEDASWYGPLFGFVFPIIVIGVLAGKDRHRKTYLVFTLLLLAVFFFSLVLFKGGWGMNRGRYLITPILAFVPLVFTLLPERGGLRYIVMPLIAASTVFLAFSTLLMNDSRPLWTTGTLEGFQANVASKIEVTNFFNSQYRKLLETVSNDLKLTAPNRQAINQNSYYGNLFFQSAKDRRDMEFISSALQDDHEIYLLTRKTLLEYALFGVNRTRNLYPVMSLEEVPAGGVVVVETALLESPPLSFEERANNEKYTILIKR